MADAATEKSNVDMKNRGGAGRVEWLDALKGVLIILVAVGPFLLPIRRYFPDFAPITATYDLIYLFHMPLFVFVSGLLSKHAVDGNGRLNVNRIITYIAIAFAFNLATLLVDGTTIDWYHITNMSGAAWYVMSLAAWTALVPLLKGLKPSVGMLLSVAVCVIASTQDAGTDLLSIGRTMHFLPYFAAGYYLSVADVERLRSGAPRVVAICAGCSSRCQRARRRAVRHVRVARAERVGAARGDRATVARGVRRAQVIARRLPIMRRVRCARVGRQRGGRSRRAYRRGWRVGGGRVPATRDGCGEEGHGDEMEVRARIRGINDEIIS